MPIGFPKNTEVTKIDNIRERPNEVSPLAEAINRLDEIKSHDTFAMRYKYCTKGGSWENARYLRGDIKSARCRVRDAYNRCLIENNTNDYRKDISVNDMYDANVEQVKGYLEIATNKFLSQAFGRLNDEPEKKDCKELIDELDQIRSILVTHKKAAINGFVYAGPPVDNIF